jgi:hypothetical protein
LCNIFTDSFKGWTHIAKYISRAEKRSSGLLSDAAILHVKSGVLPISINCASDTLDIIFSSDRLKSVTTNEVPSMLKLAGVSLRQLKVEQVVQVWGFSGLSLNGCNWARIVRNVGECCLLSLYSDEHLVGGPVLHEKTGEVLGVISRHMYKNATQSAFYVASIRSLF